HHAAGGDRRRAAGLRRQGAPGSDRPRRPRRAGREDRAQARDEGRRGDPRRRGRRAGRGRGRRGRSGSRGRSRRDRGMIFAASIGGLELPVSNEVLGVAVFVVVLIVTYVVARVVARFVGEKVRQQHVRTELVVVTRRAVTALVIVIGIFLALGWAAQNANVTLFGLLLASVVAALGVQQLLQDYVSGYYVLLAVQLGLLRDELADHLRGRTHVDAVRHLGRERAEVKGVVGLVARPLQPDFDLVELHMRRPSLDLSLPGLGGVGQVKAVQASVDAVALAQRPRAGLRDLRLAEVVAHQAEGLGRGGDAADDDRKGGHEIDEPGKERPPLQEVVMALDERRGRLEPS